MDNVCCLFDKLSRAAANRRQNLPFPDHDSRQHYVGKPPWWYYEDGTPMPDEVIAEHLQAADREAEDERERAPPLSKSAPKAPKPLLRPKIPPKATTRGTYQVGGSSSSASGGAAAAPPVIVIDPPRAQPKHPSCPPPDWNESFRRLPRVPVMVPPTEEPPSVPKPPVIPIGQFGDGVPLPPWRREEQGSPIVASPPTWNHAQTCALTHQDQVNLNWHKQQAQNMMTWGAHIAKLMTYHRSHFPQPQPPTEVHTPVIPTGPINPFILPLQPPPPPRPHAATPTPPLDPVVQAANLWEETPIPPAPALHPEPASEAPPPHPVPDRSPTPEYSPNGSHYSEGWEEVQMALPKPIPVPVASRPRDRKRDRSPSRSSSSSSSGSTPEGGALNLSDLSLSPGPTANGEEAGSPIHTIDSQSPAMQARAM